MQAAHTSLLTTLESTATFSPGRLSERAANATVTMQADGTLAHMASQIGRKSGGSYICDGKGRV